MIPWNGSTDTPPDAMRRALMPSPHARRSIVDVLLPQALAERAHAITTDPDTPVYHGLCAARRVWPSQDAGNRLL